MSTSTASRELHPSAPCSSTSPRKCPAVSRLPCRRPSMSAIASSTVSTVPSATAFSSSSTVTRGTLRSRGQRVGILPERFLDVDLADLPGEVLASADEPGDRGGGDHDRDGQRRVVERLPAEFAVPRHRFGGEWEAEDDRDQDHPERREAVHPLVLLAVVPGAGFELGAFPPTQEDRDHVGDVEPDDGDRDDRVEGERNG